MLSDHQHQKYLRECFPDLRETAASYLSPQSWLQINRGIGENCLVGGSCRGYNPDAARINASAGTHSTEGHQVGGFCTQNGIESSSFWFVQGMGGFFWQLHQQATGSGDEPEAGRLQRTILEWKK
jgi:hypothetical protein